MGDSKRAGWDILSLTCPLGINVELLYCSLPSFKHTFTNISCFVPLNYSVSQTGFALSHVRVLVSTVPSARKAVT